MEATAKDAVRPLISTVITTSNSNQVRSCAAEALGVMGVTAKDAVQPIISTVNTTSNNDQVRCSAAKALGAMEGLRKTLSDR